MNGSDERLISVMDKVRWLGRAHLIAAVFLLGVAGLSIAQARWDRVLGCATGSFVLTALYIGLVRRLSRIRRLEQGLILVTLSVLTVGVILEDPARALNRWDDFLELWGLGLGIVGVLQHPFLVSLFQSPARANRAEGWDDIGIALAVCGFPFCAVILDQALTFPSLWIRIGFLLGGGISAAVSIRILWYLLGKALCIGQVEVGGETVTRFPSSKGGCGYGGER